MITLTVNDSKKQPRKVRVSGFLNDCGTKCARVWNDRNKAYFVRVKKDGTATCTCRSRYSCYHIKAVESVRLLTVAEMEQLAAEVAANAELDVIAQAVEVVKAVTPIYGTCGHLVKPGCEDDICGGCYQKMFF